MVEVFPHIRVADDVFSPVGLVLQAAAEQLPAWFGGEQWLLEDPNVGKRDCFCHKIPQLRVINDPGQVAAVFTCAGSCPRAPVKVPAFCITQVPGDAARR